MQQNEARLKQALASVFGVSPDSIDESSSVDTVEQWTSLNHLTLVLVVEEQFNVSFTEEQTVEMLSYPLVKAVLAEHGVSFG